MVWYDGFIHKKKKESVKKNKKQSVQWQLSNKNKLIVNNDWKPYIWLLPQFYNSNYVIY